MREARKVSEDALRAKTAAWLRANGYEVEEGKQLLASKVDMHAVRDKQRLIVQVVGDSEDYRKGLQVLLAARAELGDADCLLVLPTAPRNVREVAGRLKIRVASMGELGIKESEVAETRLSDTKIKVLAAIYCCERSGREAYGYAIWRALREGFNMFKDFEDLGNIYRHLDELERMNYIKQSRAPAVRKARKLYSLTSRAKQVLEEHGMPYVERIMAIGG